MYPINKLPSKKEFSLAKNQTMECKQGAVRSVRFNVDGNYCMTCGSDKTLKLWNPNRGLLLQTYSGHGYEVLDACGSSDSAQIASSGMDKVVFIWDVSTAVASRKFRGHAAQVNAVKFNEESTIVLSGSLDGTVRAWDCKSRSKDPIQILNEAKDSVTSIQVSAQEILTGSLDGIVRRYDIRMGQLTSDDIGKPVSCVSFTHDGQCILASCMDSSLRLIDKESGDVLAQFKGHINDNYRIESCLSSTDAQILSGSEDGSVYCWDLVEGKLLMKLEHKGHRVVHSLAFHPSEIAMLTAAEGSVYYWKEAESLDIT